MNPISQADAEIYLSRAYETLNNQTCCCVIPIRKGLLSLCVVYPIATLIETIWGPLANEWTLWVLESFMILFCIYGFYGVWTQKGVAVRSLFYWLLFYVLACVIMIFYQIAEWNSACKSNYHSNTFHSCESDAWKTTFLVSRSFVILFTMYYVVVIHSYSRQLDAIENDKEAMLKPFMSDHEYVPPRASFSDSNNSQPIAPASNSNHTRASSRDSLSTNGSAGSRESRGSRGSRSSRGSRGSKVSRGSRDSKGSFGGIPEHNTS